MPLDISGPNWPPNYVPALSEWNAQFPIGRVSRGIIQSMPCQLQTQTIYGVKTSIGAFNCIVPPISSTQPGDWIMLMDIDYAAAANNVTFTATGPDLIAVYGQPLATSLIANVSDFWLMLMANTVNWRAIVRLA